jgi:Na+/H+ antiporter NhaD/arsenite permease-like protein
MPHLVGTLPSPLHHSPAIVLILLLTYAGIAVGSVPGLKLDRTGIALLGAIAMMVFGGINVAEAVSYLNAPTLMLLFGFFVLSAQLRLSGLYHRIAAGISRHLSHPAKFLLVLMLVTAGLSAILNHDVVCLVFTPIIAAALLRHRLNPVPFLIALAISSNLGAAATLIGNPQNMMIGEVAHLDFARYALWSTCPVLLALAGAFGIIWLLSRNALLLPGSPVASVAEAGPPFDLRHTVKGVVILAAVIGLFFSSLPKELVVLTAAGVHLASPKFRTSDLLRLVDWPVLVLFMGLFVITGAFQSTGCGEEIARAFSRAGFDLNGPTTLALTTTLLSNLINNSATVMLLLKVVDLSRPATAYVLAVANSFGGSFLIVGSVSNIIVVQQARSFGIEISFRQFARLGIPVTLAALGSLLAWVELVH